MDYADANYSINPWMNPTRPGDSVDPSQNLSAEETVAEIIALNPAPLPAVVTPRFLGYDPPEPGIVDVLGVGPAPLMQDTPTRQDSGMQGTLRNATGAW